ncbi:MAG: hypothetical protein ACRCSN_09305 [Dermatophilaceae bacterium]
MTITTLQEAERAGAAWQRFLEHPGDVVVAATQGAGCFGAAYEFLFTMSYHLRRAGLHREVTLTYVSAEPFRPRKREPRAAPASGDPGPLRHRRVAAR